LIPIRATVWSRWLHRTGSTDFPTGQTFHRYLNPERDVPPEAFAIHVFHTISLSPNRSLQHCGRSSRLYRRRRIDRAQCGVRFGLCQRRAGAREAGAHPARPVGRHFAPGAAQISCGSNRLDDLCARFGIDNSRRTKHGALLDAELLAEVYVELVDARQAQLGLVAVPASQITVSNFATSAKVRPVPLRPRLTDAERAAHGALLAELGAKAIWNDYVPASR